jgi:hypothetical protein
MDTLPICKAKSKQSGERCKNFATKGRSVCRIHGGKSTGAKTRQGQARQQLAKLTHGFYTEFERAERRMFKEEMKAHRETLKMI